MGFQDILLDILALKRGARFVFVGCSGEPFSLFEFSCGTTPSCLHVSPRPLGFRFGTWFGAKGLGPGLDKSEFDWNRNGFGPELDNNNDLSFILKTGHSRQMQPSDKKINFFTAIRTSVKGVWVRLIGLFSLTEHPIFMPIIIVKWVNVHYACNRLYLQVCA